MLKILPALGAVAVIAFSIGFNTARYPIVWEMVGPAANMPEESNSSEPIEASQSVKPVEPIVTVPSDNPVGSPSADNFQDKPVNSESLQTNVQALPASANSDEFSPPMTRLVPVPSSLFIGNGGQAEDQYPAVQRLPPVNQVAPIPAGRYAAEYPQSPISMYPSTGK